MINGVWNPHVFVDTENSISILEQVNAGKIPRPDFDDKNDPLVVLKLVLNYDLIVDMWNGLTGLDKTVGIFDQLVQDLDAETFAYINTRYNEILMYDASLNSDVKIYNQNTGKNETLADFYDIFINTMTKEMMKSQSPIHNSMGTKLLSSKIIKDKMLEPIYGTENELFNSIRGSNDILSSKISELFMDTDLNAISFDELYAYKDENDVWVSSNSALDFTDLSFLNIYRGFSKVTSQAVWNRNSGIQTHLHNLFGETRLNSVYHGIAIQDTNRFLDIFEERYDELGLVSPNGKINKFINFNAFNLRFDIEFFSWGVRNNYGEIPVVTKFFLRMLKNQYLYYSSHGDYLLSLAYSAII